MEELMLGFTTGDIARLLSVSSARIVQIKREIAQLINNFMGDTILDDCSSESVWERDIMYLVDHLKIDRMVDPEDVNIVPAFLNYIYKE